MKVMRLASCLALLAALLCAESVSAGVVNGGFESGAFDGWSVSGGGTGGDMGAFSPSIVASLPGDPAPDGLYYARIAASAHAYYPFFDDLVHGPISAYGNGNLSQSFSAVAGEALSLVYRVDQGISTPHGGDSASASGYFQVSGNGYTSTASLATMQGSWRTLTFPAFPTAGNYTLSANIGAQATLPGTPSIGLPGPSSQIRVDVDNVHTGTGVAPPANATFDAATDFDAGYALGNNPNGVWTYGWSSSPTSALNVYPRHRLVPGYPDFEAWDDPSNNVALTPMVYKNAGNSYDDGNIHIPAGALILHGGDAVPHDYSNVLWTAPYDGQFLVAATFTGRQTGNNVDVDIVENGNILFQNTITANSESHSYTTTLWLAAGDKIDFAVGLIDGTLGSTQLEATITAVPEPEPSTFALLSVGAISLLFYAWRRKKRAA